MKSSVNIYETNKMFYNVYEIDAYIFNILFGYKILDNKKVGFPSSIYNKVINTQEELHINYNIIYKNKDSYVKDFKKINNYSKYEKLAYEKMDIDSKVNMIIDKINNASREQLDRLVYIIYEFFKQ